jgi:ABC-type thiamine transport system substrate-binding protein
MLSQVLCINTVTSREQRIAAQDFVRFMVTREAQETLSNRGDLLPVNGTVQVSPQLAPYMQATRPLQALGSSMTNPTVWRPLNEMFRAVISGTPPVEAVDAAHSVLQSPQP